jgi:hypothetical protein
MTITLESIKAEQEKLSAMIARFEEEAKKPAFFEYQGERFNLGHGEIYIASITTPGEYGSYHLILLPGKAESINWKAAMEWAADKDGELPNRVESALLFQLAKDEFEAEAYWTREPGSDDAWAWYQHFGYGYQNLNHKSYALRARAVRRLVLE